MTISLCGWEEVDATTTEHKHLPRWYHMNLRQRGNTGKKRGEGETRRPLGRPHHPRVVVGVIMTPRMGVMEALAAVTVPTTALLAIVPLLLLLLLLLLLRGPPYTMLPLLVVVVVSPITKVR
jgi:hypothetical protein